MRSLNSSSRQLLEAIVGHLLIVNSVHVFCFWLQHYLNFQYFSNIFCTWLSERFFPEILGLLRPKLGKNDHFTIAQDSVLQSFGPCSCFDHIKSSFSALLKSFETLLQINAALIKFPLDFSLKFGKKIKQILI